MDGSLTAYLLFALLFSIGICYWAFFVLPKRLGSAERAPIADTPYKAGSGSVEP